VLGRATAGVPPRIMGFGPAPASKKLMVRLGLTPADLVTSVKVVDSGGAN